MMNTQQVKRIKWDQTLATGYDLVDNQHKTFIKRIDSFLGKCLTEQISSQEVEQAFSYLTEYVHTHFETEENLMRSCGYENLELHLQQHRYLTQQLFDIHQEWKGELPTTNQLLRMNYFLVDWVQNHILKMDAKMAESIREKVPG